MQQTATTGHLYDLLQKQCRALQVLVVFIVGLECSLDDSLVLQLPTAEQTESAINTGCSYRQNLQAVMHAVEFCIAY
jgi:hypothetical protein